MSGLGGFLPEQPVRGSPFGWPVSHIYTGLRCLLMNVSITPWETTPTPSFVVPPRRWCPTTGAAQRGGDGGRARGLASQHCRRRDLKEQLTITLLTPSIAYQWVFCLSTPSPLPDESRDQSSGSPARTHPSSSSSAAVRSSEERGCMQKRCKQGWVCRWVGRWVGGMVGGLWVGRKKGVSRALRARHLDAECVHHPGVDAKGWGREVLSSVPLKRQNHGR